MLRKGMDPRRRRQLGGPIQPPPAWKLLLTLGVVLLLIWYLLRLS